MLIKNIELLAIGLAAGNLIAAGVFALITSVGVINRMAGKTGTMAYIRKYENAVIYGGIAGNIFIIFQEKMEKYMVYGFWNYGRQTFLLALGIFMGMFVGCLATALAEGMKATAVVSRRVSLHKGTGVIVLSAAMGKFAGAILYFTLMKNIK